MDLLSDETLIFLLQVFNDLVHLGHTFDVLRISEVILLFCDKSNSHLVDFVLLLESSVIFGKVILDWRIKLSPAQYLAH